MELHYSTILYIHEAAKARVSITSTKDIHAAATKSMSKVYGCSSLFTLRVKEIFILLLRLSPFASTFDGSCVEGNSVTVCWACYLLVRLDCHGSSLGPAVPESVIPPVGHQSVWKRGKVSILFIACTPSSGLTLHPLPVPELPPQPLPPRPPSFQ